MRWARRAGGSGGLEYAYDVEVPSTDQAFAVGQLRGAAVFGPGEPGQFQLSAGGGNAAGFVVGLEP